MATKYPIALSLAFQWHKDQFRDESGIVPYIAHPIEVVANLVQIGGIEEDEVLSAAILHDTIEESGVSPDEIEGVLGHRVADLVVQMTREEPPPSQADSLSADDLYQLRSRLLLEGISRMDVDAMTIKLADRLSNLRWSVMVRKGAKLKRYLTQTDRILEIIPKRVNPKLWNAVEKERRGV